MIHSQDVNICDKNYICFISVKALAFNLVFKYFTVTTTKSFMKSPSRFYACSYYSMTPRNRNFYIDFPGPLNRGLQYYYVTIVQYHSILYVAWP